MRNVSHLVNGAATKFRFILMGSYVTRHSGIVLRGLVSSSLRKAHSYNFIVYSTKEATHETY